MNRSNATWISERSWLNCCRMRSASPPGMFGMPQTFQLLSKAIQGEATGTSLSGELAEAAIVVVACTSLWTICSFGRFYVLGLLNDRYVSALRSRVVAVWFATPWHVEGRSARADIAARFSQDIGAVEGALGSSMPVLLVSLLQCVGCLAMLSYTSLALLGVLGVFTAMVAGLFLLAERRIISMSRLVQDANEQMVSLALEVLPEVRTVQQLGQQETKQFVSIGCSTLSCGRSGEEGSSTCRPVPR